MNLNKLTANIEQWAVERGLDEAEPEKQKTEESKSS